MNVGQKVYVLQIENGWNIHDAPTITVIKGVAISFDDKSVIVEHGWWPFTTLSPFVRSKVFDSLHALYRRLNGN